MKARDVWQWACGAVLAVAVVILLPINWVFAIVFCGQLIDLSGWLRKRRRRKLWKSRRES